MSNNFGIPQITDYLRQMGIKIAHLDQEQRTVELVFHSDHGQWRMVIGVHQRGSASKLMLIVPHIGTISSQKRLECLEALMTINYRIAIGKFGLDIEDGEVRLEETIPLANDSLSFEQFRLAFSAIMQTVSIYHNLLPRIIHGTLSVEDALQACEQEYFQSPHALQSAEIEAEMSTADSEDSSLTSPTAVPHQIDRESEQVEWDVSAVLAEVDRMLKEHRD